MNSVFQEQSALSKLFKNKVFRFFLSAGVATLADVIIYFITFSYILDNKGVYFLNTRMTAHEFSLVISYTVGVIINFLLTKYAVFSESDLAGRKQFFRFALIAGIGFFANYILLRFFVEICDFYPTLARVFSALSLGVASFYVHQFFTFKTKVKNEL